MAGLSCRFDMKINNTAPRNLSTLYCFSIDSGRWRMIMKMPQ